MKCKQCNKIHNNKSFCSNECKRLWIIDNNINNNPIWDLTAKKKMVESKRGVRPSAETKLKMSNSHKAYFINNREEMLSRVKNLHEKYTSKIAGTGWRKVRIRALERDGYMCTLCGESSYRLLVVHHIDWQGKRRGVSAKNWNNEISNLQTLCHKCHNGIHRHKSIDYKQRAINHGSTKLTSL